MVGRPRLRAIARGVGYNLVALMVLVAVINITVAAALPSLSQAIQREREAELIFRGLQYAEAIRVFQLRTGRYPVSLRELLELNPRCIRQLWTDPFNDDGEWGLILGQGGAAGRQVAGGSAPSVGRDEREGQRRRRRRQPTPEEVEPRERVSDPNGRGVPRRGQVVSRGPIIGVKSLSDEEAIRSFMGGTKHSDWLFTVDLIPTMEAPVVGENVPRLHTLWVGKPFPEGLDAAQPGTMPTDQGSSNPLDRGRNRRGSRRRERSDG
jgi:type II secretory pathway pseudopilin PulG